MKFLIFTSEYPPMRTGVAIYNQIIAEGLIQRGHEVTVLTFRPPRDRSPQTPAREVRLPIGTQKWLEPARIIAGWVVYCFLARRFDVTLLTSDLAQLIAGDLNGGVKARFVCVVHGSEVTKRFPKPSLLARAAWRLRLGTLRRASQVVAISHYTRDLLVTAGLGQSTIKVIHHGIPEAWFNVEPDVNAIQRFKQLHGIRSDEIVVLTLARVVYRKGHDRVLRALHHIRGRQPKLRYLVVGMGEHLPQIRKLAEELDLDDLVIFTGEIAEQEKRAYYDLCDIFVMPSLHDGLRVEGLGLSFIEAAARRKPSIGGRHGGVPEVIEEGRTGYLVDPEDIEMLAERLSILAADGELRQRLGEAAYVNASKRFRDTTMIVSIERLLKTVAHRGEG